MATYKQEFNTIADFYRYICDTPLNDAFRWEQLSSSKRGESKRRFTSTDSFEEATQLLHDGWTDMAKRLTNELKSNFTVAPTMKARTTLDVAGFQPVVALYLAGVPQNMLNTKMVPIKSKIITLTKSINYNCGVSTETIIAESIKTMQVIKKLEAQGFRVTLNVALGVEAGGRSVISKVCVKRANEKLNVSKLAFPLVHPSMLRRLFFRYIEVCPDVTRSFVMGYGMPVSFRNMQAAFPKDIVLPAIWKVDPSEIKSIDSLQASF